MSPKVAPWFSLDPHVARRRSRERLVLALVAAAWPAFVGLVPPLAGTPAGWVFLPMFVAPLVAARLLGPGWAVAYGAAGPGFNCATAALPVGMLMPLLTLELAIFGAAAAWLDRRMDKPVVPVLFALALAKLGVLGTAYLLPDLVPLGQTPFGFVTATTAAAWPGMILLGLLHAALAAGRQAPGKAAPSPTLVA